MRTYYIYNNLPSEFQDMLDGARIVCLDNDNLILRHNDKDGEGPFSDLKELKENSKIYLNLMKNDKKRAVKIVLDAFIVKCQNIIAFPADIDKDYEKIIYRIMQHSKNGDISRKNVSGIHLFDIEKIRIIKVINKENSIGIFSAEVEVLNKRTGKWVKKESITTFFPISWNLQKLIIECFFAYKNRIKINETEYKGKTKSGITVYFQYNNFGEFKTLYPIYE